MSSSPISANDATIPIVMSQEMRLNAKTFSQQQPDETSAQRVYRNTLAVSAVERYLTMLGIVTHLPASDSWNPVLRLANDVADLAIGQDGGRGRLECRAIRPIEESCYIPLEVQCDRIAYIVVQLDNDQQATLMGFVERVDSEHLPLNQLRPLSELPYCLAQRKTVVNLRQWLEALYQLDWQAADNLLQPQQLALSPCQASSQASIQRAKLIELNLYSEHSDVILLLSVTNTHSDKTASEPTSNEASSALSVRAQLHPAIVTAVPANGTRFTHSPADCLLPNIKLSLLSDDGQLIQEVISRTHPRDNCIQIPQFQGQLGERFTLTIAVEGRQMHEYFQI